MRNDYYLTKEKWDYLSAQPEVAWYNVVANAYTTALTTSEDKHLLLGLESALEMAGIGIRKIVNPEGKSIVADFLMWAHPGRSTETRVFVDGEQVDIPSVG